MNQPVELNTRFGGINKTMVLTKQPLVLDIGFNCSRLNCFVSVGLTYSYQASPILYGSNFTFFFSFMFLSSSSSSALASFLSFPPSFSLEILISPLFEYWIFTPSFLPRVFLPLDSSDSEDLLGFALFVSNSRSLAGDQRRRMNWSCGGVKSAVSELV